MLVLRERVAQAIDLGWTATFLKEVHRVDLGPEAGGGGLGLVRKLRDVGPSGAPRAPVLLIHGYAQNRYSWHSPRGRSLANYLANAGYDVFNVDLRGAGRSRKLFGAPFPEHFADYVAGDLPRVLDHIAEVTGERRVTLIGHSLGGAVACAVAGRLPDRVGGVVTIAGLYAFGRRSRFIRALGRGAALVARAGSLLRPGLALRTDLLGRGLGLARRLFDSPRLAALLPLRAWAPGAVEPEILEDHVRRAFEPVSLGVTLGLAAMARGGPFGDREGASYLEAFEARIDLPLLVVTGGCDCLIDTLDSRDAYDRSRSTDKELRVFGDGAAERGSGGGGGSGHIDLVLGRDAPRRVWPALREWLDARRRIP